jgi:hypothetical protein
MAMAAALGCGAQGEAELAAKEATSGGKETPRGTLVAAPPATRRIARAPAQFLDVNGDLRADVAIGAPGANTTFVYLGGRGGLAATPTATLVGADQAGAAVANAGDVNGDGYGDLVVGSGMASASVYLGGPGGVQPNGTALDPGGALRFGVTVSAAGDVNGDGFGDVIVGTRYGAGLYLGGARGIGGAAARFLVGPGAAALTVLGGVDFNRDRRPDLGVASGNLGVNVYLDEASGPPAAASATLAGTGGATPAGDVNGDGYADGRVEVHAGGAAGVAQRPPLVTLAGPGGVALGDPIGATLSSAGDVNHDGYDDVLLGAPAADRAFLFLGARAAVGGAAPAATLAGAAGSSFGAAVAGVGDVNGDGYDDVVVGAPGAGQAQLFLGGPSGLATRPAATLGGPPTFGAALARFAR